MARIGKIARLPASVREEINLRLRNGVLGPELLPWLNELPEVKQVLNGFFDGKNINAQNLSDWRNGGFKDWLERQDRNGRLKLLTEKAMDLVKATGGNLTDSAAAIAAGQALELLEAADGNLEPDQVSYLIGNIAKLKAADLLKVKSAQDDRKIKQKDEEISLNRQKFHRDTCKLFLEWAQDRRAAEIAAGAGSNSEKIERLGQLMFGEDWKPEDGAPSQEPADGQAT